MQASWIVDGAWSGIIVTTPTKVRIKSEQVGAISQIILRLRVMVYRDRREPGIFSDLLADIIWIEKNRF